MKFIFESCELMPDSYELLVDGTPKPVEPQVFDLLLCLVSKAGQLISQDELIEKVWAGRIVSDSTISARISAARAAIGDDGSAQKMIKTIPRRGFRFVAEVHTTTDTASVIEKNIEKTGSAVNQRLRFCASRDGTQIAYATTGSGYPLIRAGHWLTHLEHDWHSPVWRPFLDQLGKDYTVTRYDQRGNGLSDWDVDDFSLDKFVEDLEAVVDAAKVDRFALYGTSQGAPIAISYAVLHPERVSHLILHGGYVRGRLLRGSAEERADGQALLTLIRHGWGKPNHPLIQAFSTMYIPGATQEQISSLVELQRLTTSPENAANLRAAVDQFNVTDLLKKLDVPTLIFHARNDGIHPLDQGRKLAAGIKNAEMILLESDNHVILAHEPAWEVLFDEIRRFVLA